MSSTATDLTSQEDRPLKPALLRGWRRKCPNCGQGAMLKGYLKVVDSCAVCEEELHHHRADDGPAWLTMLVVLHIMGFVMHIWFVHFRPEPIVMATGLTVGSVAAALYLLPRFKGVFVAFQWSREMGGFGHTPR